MYVVPINKTYKDDSKQTLNIAKHRLTGFKKSGDELYAAGHTSIGFMHHPQ